jgi:acetyltransferase-like isoleucine patch superfamily enzyme
VAVHHTAEVCNALFNTESGSITVEENAMFGQNVMLVTGTHDLTKLGSERPRAVPREGHNIVVEEGAFIASGAIVLGPCVIGRHAVVAAGALVRADVPPSTMVAGVPARRIRSVV